MKIEPLSSAHQHSSVHFATHLTSQTNAVLTIANNAHIDWG